MYADQLMIHDNGKYKKGTIVRITDKRRVFRIILSLFPTHVGVIPNLRAIAVNINAFPHTRGGDPVEEKRLP